MENDKKKKKVVIKFDGEEWVHITDPRNGTTKVKPTGKQNNLDQIGIVDLKDPKKIIHKVSGIWPDEIVIFTNSPGCAWYWNGRKWIWR
jgi:hypothetical protein